MAYLRSVSRLILIVYIVNRAVCEDTEDFCGYKSSSMVPSVSLGATGNSQWSEDDACRCVISPNFNSSNGVSRLVTLAVEFTYHARQDVGLPPCLPILLVEPTMRSMTEPKPLAIKYNVCPEVDTKFSHMNTVEVYKGQEFVFHLYNPNREHINSKVSVNEFDGTLQVTCDPYERIMYEEDSCPCSSSDPYDVGAGIDREAEKFNEKRRLTIGLVTAFVFALIIVAIIVGVIYYRKRKAKKALRATEAVTVENKAYEGSKQSVASENKQGAPKGSTISYTPDPNLNLKLQKPGHHGSKDSGLASSNDNEKARLPFMQPPPASRSLENLTQMPTNYPSIAGQGSQSSLNNVVEPVYTTRQAQRPQHLPVVAAGRPGPGDNSPSNQPALAGQGSQSSLDHAPPYTKNPDDVYARPAKRRHQQPDRSQSHDNVATTNDEQYHSAASLNTSKETDI